MALRPSLSKLGLYRSPRRRQNVLLWTMHPLTRQQDDVRAMTRPAPMNMTSRNDGNGFKCELTMSLLGVAPVSNPTRLRILREWELVPLRILEAPSGSMGCTRD